MPTHKKGHDKDKYYHLAKDQGYRSRAAFKLIQINKRFDFLSKSKVLVDLCAAPGGWCQVAAKFMPVGSIVLGIDLLPIRPIRNVKTIVADITTSECRRIVTQELQGWKADVFLCDGAPNIGANYSKDAFVQNELVLAALKSATDHLIEGGTFCTKVYRSADYNALIWVLQQFFEDVQAIKPNSSRSQSSEIFIVCQRYIAPQKIDPKLLDPNHVFKEVTDPGLAKINVLHKSYEKHNKRHRTGYDESLGITLTKTATISEFVHSKDAVRLLTDVNKIEFKTSECETFRTHPLTTTELLACFDDLRVLGKIDFKKLLKWRLAMRKKLEIENKSDSNDADDTVEVEVREGMDATQSTEEDIQSEIANYREKMFLKDRREKKKDRRLAAKERMRQAMGIRNNAFEVSEEVELFSLNNTTTGDVDDLYDVDVEDELGVGAWEDDENDAEKDDGGLIELPDGTLEEELEAQYARYISRQRSKRDSANGNVVLADEREEGTEDGRVKSAKKARLARTSDGILNQRLADDEDVAANLPDDVATYAEALTGTKVGLDGDSDDEDDEEEDGDILEADQDDHDDDKIPRKTSRTDRNKPAATRDKDPMALRISKWYSHPIFKQTLLLGDDSVATDVKNSVEDDGDDGNGGGSDDGHVTSGRKRKSIADEVVESMPKTDKEKRQEKRKKAVSRTERRLEKRKAALADEDELHGTGFGDSGFEVAPGSDATTHGMSGLSNGDNDDEEQLRLSDPKEAARRQLIREGMGKLGKVIETPGSSSKSIEVVPMDTYASDDDADDDGPASLSLPTRFDERSYGSDDEQYDKHDRAVTLALGTLMLRKSRQKALVDASYNRFAWNDPKDLPDWFVDDEMKHNKPQVPVPSALLQQIKSRYQMTGTREIKKVAEARARKKKRAMSKLKAAKKQANILAGSSELSDKQKIKSIAKAMRSSKQGDKAAKAKQYIVTKKTGGASSGTSLGGKGKLKFVDKRLKKDGRKIKQKKYNEKKR